MNRQNKDFLADNDKVLKSIIQTIPEPEIVSTHHVFHDIVSCIIEQQIHYRSTKKTFQKILDAANLNIVTTDNFVELEEKGLKNVKMSMSKYETLARVVDFFETDNLDWSAMPDEEVRKTLAQIKGIGTWTIDMILLYSLQRPNLFPADDYHLKKIMCNLYGIDTTAKVKAQLKAVSDHWSPYKSLAVRYLLDWKTYQSTQKINR